MQKLHTTSSEKLLEFNAKWQIWFFNLPFCPLSCSCARAFAPFLLFLKAFSSHLSPFSHHSLFFSFPLFLSSASCFFSLCPRCTQGVVISFFRWKCICLAGISRCSSQRDDRNPLFHILPLFYPSRSPRDNKNDNSDSINLPSWWSTLGNVFHHLFVYFRIGFFIYFCGGL